MDISSSIVSSAMAMKAQQFAAQYSTGVMKAQMDFTEEIASQLIDQLATLDVGMADVHAIDVAV